MHIVVVGAGILGASTGSIWSERAPRSLSSIRRMKDAPPPRARASSVRGSPARDDAAFYRLYVEGARYYGELVAALAELGETDLGFRRVGRTRWFRRDADELAAFNDMLRRRRARDAGDGRDAALLSAARGQDTVPAAARTISRALHVANGARVDGRRWRRDCCVPRRASARRAIEGHAELIGGRRSCRRRQTARCNGCGRLRGCHRRRLGTVAAVAPRCGTADRAATRPDRAPAICRGRTPRNWPVVLPPGSHYLLAFDDSRVVAGATRETGVGFDYRVTAAGQAEVLAEALHVAPGLATATIIETRVGFRPVGPGVRPLLGPIARTGRAADRQWPGRGGTDHWPALPVGCWLMWRWDELCRLIWRRSIRCARTSADQRTPPLR